MPVCTFLFFLRGFIFFLFFFVDLRAFGRTPITVPRTSSSATQHNSGKCPTWSCVLTCATTDACRDGDAPLFSETFGIWELKTSSQKLIWRKIKLLPDENFHVLGT